MPQRNVRGGKGFKKGRKDNSDRELRMKFDGKTDGQQYARITTILGDRRFKCFCDDGVERICKVRGVLCWGPRRQKMEIGDIVLISERSFGDEGADSDSERTSISDIITKIPQQYWRDIRREAGIHADLFLGATVSMMPASKKDDIFDDAEDGSGDDDESGEGSEDEEGNTIRHVAPAPRSKRAPKWAAAVTRGDDDDGGRGANDGDAGDIDVDAI
jgi:initiation factor 1A